MFAVVAVVMLGAFVLRSATDLSVQRDRSPNFVRLSSGDVRNSYTVKISNKSQQPRNFRLAVTGLPRAAVTIANIADRRQSYADAHGTCRRRRHLPGAGDGAGEPGSDGLAADRVQVAADPDNQQSATHESVFVGPPR